MQYLLTNTWSTILQSSKAAGVRIITNLVVLGARDQDSENSKGSDQEIGAFELKMILRRVFANEIAEIRRNI